MVGRKHSTIRSGRTIGAEREQLETASERNALHQQTKRKKTTRLILTIIGFIAVIALITWLFFTFSRSGETLPAISEIAVVPYSPTIEVIDEDAAATGGHLTGRMKEYIGQAEADLRELGLIPVKAVIPTGAIREVDFYLEGYSGFIKMTIDRGTGVSAEDTDRMLRYLASIGVTNFQYIDVRLDRQAYWK